MNFMVFVKHCMLPCPRLRRPNKKIKDTIKDNWSESLDELEIVSVDVGLWSVVI